MLFDSVFTHVVRYGRLSGEGMGYRGHLEIATQHARPQSLPSPPETSNHPSRSQTHPHQNLSYNQQTTSSTTMPATDKQHGGRGEAATLQTRISSVPSECLMCIVRRRYGVNRVPEVKLVKQAKSTSSGTKRRGQVCEALPTL